VIRTRLTETDDFEENITPSSLEYKAGYWLGLPIGSGSGSALAARMMSRATTRVMTKGAASVGRFQLTNLGSSLYQTPAGLIYGPGSKHGHRLTHVLQHGFPDATKKTHSVFSSGSGALRTVDEAWLKRGAPDPSDLKKYVVPMGRTIGSGGETSVTIIVRPGTSQIITAYPSS
jgi:hypothetical protein